MASQLFVVSPVSTHNSHSSPSFTHARDLDLETVSPTNTTSAIMAFPKLPVFSNTSTDSEFSSDYGCGFESTTAPPRRSPSLLTSMIQRERSTAGSASASASASASEFFASANASASTSRSSSTSAPATPAFSANFWPCGKPILRRDTSIALSTSASEDNGTGLGPFSGLKARGLGLVLTPTTSDGASEFKQIQIPAPATGLTSAVSSRRACSLKFAVKPCVSLARPSAGTGAVSDSANVQYKSQSFRSAPTSPRIARRRTRTYSRATRVAVPEEDEDEDQDNDEECEQDEVMEEDDEEEDEEDEGYQEDSEGGDTDEDEEDEYRDGYFHTYYHSSVMAHAKAWDHPQVPQASGSVSRPHLASTNTGTGSGSSRGPGRKVSIAEIHFPTAEPARCSRHLSPPPSSFTSLAPEPAPPAASSPSARGLCRKRESSVPRSGTPAGVRPPFPMTLQCRSKSILRTDPISTPSALSSC